MSNSLTGIERNEEESRKPVEKQVNHRGNMKHRFILALLSFLFSGWGQWQGHHRVKGAVFLFGPVAAMVATIILESPGFFYLAAVTGLFTGPLIVSAPIIGLGLIPSFNSPLFLLGIPVKLICIIDSWFLGGKKARKPLVRKWFLIFTTTSLFTFGIFAYKFSFIRAQIPSVISNIEPGDTIVVLNRSRFGISTLFSRNKIKRGDIVAFRDGNKKVFSRVIALPDEKVTIQFNARGEMEFAIQTGNKNIKISMIRSNEPCVFFDSDGKYTRCYYVEETISPELRYRTAYKSGNSRLGSIEKITLDTGTKYLLIPDIRTEYTLKNYMKDGWKLNDISDILGSPISILWSSWKNEGIRWHRIGSDLSGKTK
ncbi:MAG: S24 family peptidase [Deltaproteobacteria bacterium]|nr:S24 family peptidase [Deltaproteobacteria bacterium]